MAAAGKGQGADQPDEKEGTRLRTQALDWLRADLALWVRELNKGTPQARLAVQRALTQWQQHLDLASLRGPEALTWLPGEERQAWLKFWTDVDALLVKARDAR